MAKRSTLLYNHLRHADTHNRVQEEMEMWRLRKLELQRKMEPVRSSKRRSPMARGRLISDTLEDEEEGGALRSRRGHERVKYRSRSPPTFIAQPSIGQQPSTYWTRQLMKAEESDPHRWGHGGYKELYPDEFISSSDEGEGEGGDDGVTDVKKKQQIKKKESKKHKKEKSKKKDKRKKKMKKTKNRISNGDDNS